MTHPCKPQRTSGQARRSASIAFASIFRSSSSFSSIQTKTLMTEMDDDCCYNPGKEQGKQAEQSPQVLNEPYDEAEYNRGGCAIEDYAAHP